MAENFNLSRIRHDKQEVFLGTGKLIGCNSINVTNNFALQPMLYMGIGGKAFTQTINGEQYADVSINSYLINMDDFFPLIQEFASNLFILYDRNKSSFGDLTDNRHNYLLISGYLNTYSAKYSIGQIPQIDVSMRFVDNGGSIDANRAGTHASSQLTSITVNNNYNYTGSYLIPNGDSIQLYLDEITTNRVLNYDININVNRKPIYNIGSKKPKRVDIIYPIEVNCQFGFEMSEYNITQLREQPSSPQVKTIYLNVFDQQNNRFICGYRFKNMNLISETYSNSADGNVIVNKQYVGFFNAQDNTQNYLYNEVGSGNLNAMGISFSSTTPFTGVT